jgi:colanic acid biosynthesis glycosyl transferase WcaI
MLSRRWRIPYVFHVADLQPDAAVDLGMLRSGQTINLLYKLERLAYRKASLVSTLTPAMRRKIILKGISPEKVVVCSDWAEPALFSLASEERAQRFRHLHGVQDRFLVVHAGNMGVKQSLEVVLDAAEHARRGHPQLLFLLVGDGAMRSKLEQSARRRKLENVRFLPILDREPFRDLLAASDVCLVTQQKSVADIVFPSKVLTLLSAGRPVVASLSGGSEVARVVNESGAGIVARPEDPAVLCDAVLDLYDHPEKRAVMGASGRAYARNQWDRDRILSRFEEQLEEVAGGSGGAYVAARA